MKILVTGGTGVIGAGAIPELLKSGHEVRLLSRGAKRDAQDYPERVEPFPADVTDTQSLAGAADDCDAVVHITGIIDESPPDKTYERINVEGTRHVLAEAKRAGVERFIYVSSLGADTGESDYHRSKFRAEELVRASDLAWTILRPGNVYGPGDEVISSLLKMIRMLPAIPMVGHGDQPFQPIWFQDLGAAIARACDDIETHHIYELAGPDITTTCDVIEQLCAITGRHPTKLPLPAWLAQIGANVTEMFGGIGKKLAADSGVGVPMNSAKLKMLLEGNVAESGRNDLLNVFGVSPTPLKQGLTTLTDLLPELLPEDGIGKLHRKCFWADIQHSRCSASDLLQRFGDHLCEIMPIDFAAEPGVPTRSAAGTTLTGAIPGRGNIQVRVEEQTPEAITLASIQGHPLAGLVTFRAKDAGSSIRFEVEVHARAANIVDWLALNIGGTSMQKQNWVNVVNRVVELSGGEAPAGVQHSTEDLQDAEAERVEAWARNLVRNRKREQTTSEIRAAV